MTRKLSLISALLILINLSYSQSAPTAPLTFTWHMQETFFETVPDALTLTLDACHTSAPLPVNTLFVWHLQPDVRPLAEELRLFSSSACHAIITLPPDHYTVSLIAQTPDGEVTESSQRLNLTPFVIVSLGDSYASGEGNPDSSATPAPELHLLHLLTTLAEALDVLNQDTLQLEPTTPLTPDILAKQLSTSLSECQVANVLALLRCAQQLKHYAQAFQGLFTHLQDGLDTLQPPPSPQNVAWQDETCHRSRQNSHHLAARTLSAQYPQRIIVHLNLACSGASIQEGLLGPQTRQKHADGPTIMVQGQLQQLLPLLKSETIGALLLSVGGNDSSFTDLMKVCSMQADCHLPHADVTLDTDLQSLCQIVLGDLETLTQQLRPLLPETVSLDMWLSPSKNHARYWRECEHHFSGDFTHMGPSALLARHQRSLSDDIAALNTALHQQLAPDPARVLLIGYPNLSRNQDGALCNWSVLRSSREIPVITAAEMGWLEQTLYFPLTTTLAQASAQHGWQYVDTAPPFTGHGYCATDSWFVRSYHSLLSQNDMQGSLHPNRQGHEATALLITPLLKALIAP